MLSWALLLIGLAFHVLNILSVFDCYFTSPVVNGMGHFSAKSQAKRVVLVVADGLRADLVFNTNPFPNIPNSPKIVAPFLRHVMEHRGTFGVSHTRVPTESRPGHVALIGGMYEDVSAVTKGWKTNPVDFDSVFNQSSHTFSFGSPDILPMFAQGATPGKVKTWMYDEDQEDFTKDATNLDTWVLDQLKTLLNNATLDQGLKERLHEQGVVFFLHLLGLDTTGHSYRPHSVEYMRNIQVVDSIVRDTEALLDSFYGKDGETAFVFTADHGMSVIGNHGDGDPDNTRTPLVVWGKGIRAPSPDPNSSSHDAYSMSWELSHLRRSDVEQADVAALMATLLGSAWPANGVGVLPDVRNPEAGYLDMDAKDLAQVALVNAKVVLEQYRVKHELKRAHTLFYRPYVFPTSQSSDPEDEARHIEQALEQGHVEDARKLAHQTIQETLEGLRYLQTYDRLLLRTIVSLAYLGWAAYASLSIFPTASKSQPSVVPKVLFGTTLLGFWALFFLERAKWTYYIYIFFPTFFWYHVTNRILSEKEWLKTPKVSIAKLTVGVFSILCILECMVTAYTRRGIWSILFLLLPLSTFRLAWTKPMLYGAWTISCLTTSSFMLGGLDYEESLGFILFGGFVMLGSAELARRQTVKTGHKFILFQMVLILLSMAVTSSSVMNLKAKQGLPLANQLAGWILLSTSLLAPILAPISVETNEHLLRYFLTFCPLFIMLSIRIEGLFYVMYCLTLRLWIEVEASLKKRATSRAQFRPKLDHLRIALSFLFFVQIGFFGTGNIASISSFYLEPVFRLVPIFSPFLMAALLIFKIVAPYVMLSACFATLRRRLGVPPYSLFLLSLAITDGMTIRFFWNVTDTGSWLEIGQSISFFIITSLLLVWSAGICAAGEWMMGEENVVKRVD